MGDCEKFKKFVVDPLEAKACADLNEVLDRKLWILDELDDTGQDTVAAIVIEDMDLALRDRKNDNPTMYKLLAMSDGFVSFHIPKILISTNVNSTEQIDDALIRKGRCFDVVDFDVLRDRASGLSRCGIL